MKDPRDRELGLAGTSPAGFPERGGPRRGGEPALSPRDGCALAFGLPPGLRQKAASYYPPALTGLRGSTEGTFEAAHALKDGAFWKMTRAPSTTGETYDLVVVGAGISGLASAYFYRKAAGAGARVLLLDNHDDFGGHAKRNEFNAGRAACSSSYGGTQSIDSPGALQRVGEGPHHATWASTCRSWRGASTSEALQGPGQRASSSTSETFGQRQAGQEPLGRRARRGLSTTRRGPAASQRGAALGGGARRDIAPPADREEVDYLPGLSSAEKKARLARMSYADYLTKVVEARPGRAPFSRPDPHGLFGVGIDTVSAQDAWGLGLPGLRRARARRQGDSPGMNRDAIPSEEAERYYFHFPDGNATVARLLVQRLDPRGVSPGSTADDVVTARVDYGAPRRAGRGQVRLRLNSTVVQREARRATAPRPRRSRSPTSAAARCARAREARASWPAGTW